MSKLIKNEVSEEQFLIRYGKHVEVYNAVVIKDKKMSESIVAIIDTHDGNKKYTLHEHLNQEGMTEFVNLSFCDKTFKYKSYLEAEVMVADLIGRAGKNG